jgi:hypothetical protein
MLHSQKDLNTKTEAGSSLWRICRREVLYRGKKFYTGEIKQLCLRFKKKIPTRVLNPIPGYETTYPGMKPHTQVWNHIPSYETLHPGAKVVTWCQHRCLWKNYLG